MAMGLPWMSSSLFSAGGVEENSDRPIWLSTHRGAFAATGLSSRRLGNNSSKSPMTATQKVGRVRAQRRVETR